MAESLEFLFRMLWVADAVHIASWGVIIAAGVTAAVVALMRRRSR